LLGFGPGYEQMFRALSQVVELDAPPTGDADYDAAQLLERIASGRTYSLLRGIATPGLLMFEARQNGGVRRMGEWLDPGQAEFHAEVEGAPTARLVLLAEGRPIAEGEGSLAHGAMLEPGTAVRVEVFYPGGRLPWIVSNPVYTRGAVARATPAPPEIGGVLEPLGSDAGWVIERDASSRGDIRVEANEIRFMFALGDDVTASPYAALVRPVDSESGFDLVTFTARASRPMRVWIQVRLPGAEGGQRWGRSVFLDQTPRTVVLPFQELDPLDGPSGQQPVEATVTGVLIVIDTVNTERGTTGTLWLSEMALGVGQVSRGASAGSGP
jgi:hypothetical protein